MSKNTPARAPDPPEARPGAAVAGEIPYNQLPIPKRIEDRPTEDALAQAALGGPKGAPNLPPAPLTKTEAEQTLPNDDPGQTA
jgi:hypothetical protein